MDPNLLLLLFLTLTGRGLADDLLDDAPEVLRVPVGLPTTVHCRYGHKDIRARKVWCRLLAGICQPLASSVVDRGAPRGARRVFLTDLGGGLLQVDMLTLQEEDAGEYRCVVEGAAGPQTLHRVQLVITRPASSLKDEETYRTSSETDVHSSDPVGSASPVEPRQDEKGIPLIWGAALLPGLLLVAVVLFAIMVKRKGNKLAACRPLQRSRMPGVGPHSVNYHINDSGLAVDLPSDVPFVKLDSLPSFDNSTYASPPLDPLSGDPPPPSPSPPLPNLVCAKPVTYATVIFRNGDKGGRTSCEPAQDPLGSETPPS
ncbi:PREDICTED: trem-like transcript 1 protein [Elephantulus edwardii]|uniref:trem-like transcript 1 protein n=1 Tax=Elephantulus edwardii TaxID=28737 RepID=UPI0003F09155|nr:PREDICTED: trem-like transcript 1 protein [Elephantulus edwardii]